MGTNSKATTYTRILHLHGESFINVYHLRKLVDGVHRNAPAQSANVLNHAIHNGRIEVVRMLEKLLDGGE